MRVSIEVSSHQAVWAGGWQPKTQAGLRRVGTGGVGPGSRHKERSFPGVTVCGLKSMRELVQCVSQRHILGEGGGGIRKTGDSVPWRLGVSYTLTAKAEQLNGQPGV